MTAHIVSLSKECYFDLAEKMPPQHRLVWVDSDLPKPHYWLYADPDNIVVFTPVPIETRQSFKVTLTAGTF